MLERTAERLLIEVVDALHDSSGLADELSERLARLYTPAQALDLFMLTGWYHAISYAANAAGVPLEADAPRFADVTDIAR